MKKQKKLKEENYKITVCFANEPQKWRFPAWKIKEFEKKERKISEQKSMTKKNIKEGTVTLECDCQKQSSAKASGQKRMNK